VIPYSIATMIAAGVDAMATPTYNFAYGAVDVIPPVDSGLPLVYLDFQEETGLPPGETVVGKYTIDAPLSFRVLVPKSVTLAPDDQAIQVTNDIKKLMNSLHDALQAVGMTFADFTGASKTYRLVRAYPVQVTVNFNIRFRQLKTNPGGE
jgi:hypothetical protein